MCLLRAPDSSLKSSHRLAAATGFLKGSAIYHEERVNSVRIRSDGYCPWKNAHQIGCLCSGPPDQIQRVAPNRAIRCDSAHSNNCCLKAFTIPRALSCTGHGFQPFSGFFGSSWIFGGEAEISVRGDLEVPSTKCGTTRLGPETSIGIFRQRLPVLRQSLRVP